MPGDRLAIIETLASKHTRIPPSGKQNHRSKSTCASSDLISVASRPCLIATAQVLISPHTARVGLLEEVPVCSFRNMSVYTLPPLPTRSVCETSGMFYATSTLFCRSVFYLLSYVSLCVLARMSAGTSTSPSTIKSSDVMRCGVARICMLPWANPGA